MTIIEVHELHKKYTDTVAVRNVSFTVERGEIFGILGKAGAGKTTIVECIEGLRRPDSGTIRVLGLDPVHDRVALRRRLSAQLQSCALPERLRVSDLLELFASFYPDPADPAQLMALFGLSQHGRTPYGLLLRSQQQRLSMAIALVGKPEIVVFDEPAAGLDGPACRQVWELIRRVRDAGVTLLLVTSSGREAERLCDRVALIDAGRVIALGTPAGLVTGANTQRIRFRPMTPLDLSLVEALPEVSSVRRQGDQVVITGTNQAWRVVTAVLARRRIIAADLRLERADLEDALVALTARGVTGGCRSAGR
ncbi:MAG TPA: ABC transporter ATP-binding protein [Pseudonocardiaceae bacterium]